LFYNVAYGPLNFEFHSLLTTLLKAPFHYFLVAIVIMAAVISGKFLTITSVISAVQSLGSVCRSVWKKGGVVGV
jgi:hypothetical protein